MKTSHFDGEIFVTEVCLKPFSFMTKKSQRFYFIENMNKVFHGMNGFYILTEGDDMEQLNKNVETLRQEVVKYLDKCKEDLNHHYIKSDAE